MTVVACELANLDAHVAHLYGKTTVSAKHLGNPNDGVADEVPSTLNSKPTPFCSGTTEVVPACLCALQSTVGSLLAGAAREKGRRRIDVTAVPLHWAYNPVHTVSVIVASRQQNIILHVKNDLEGSFNDECSIHGRESHRFEKGGDDEKILLIYLIVNSIFCLFFHFY